MNVLELVGLRRQFGRLVACDNIDLAIEEGEIRGLIGPNGSGKTTLFNLITGFLRPTKGKVIWKGHDVTGQPPQSMVRRGVVRTFQIPTLFKDMTVLENLVIASHLQRDMGLFQQFLRTPKTRKREKAIEERAMGLLEAVGIADMKDMVARDLPLGHQKALELAIALAVKPQLLLLDEPTSGMNLSETRDMMERIKSLVGQGITIAIVEHNMRAIMTTCEKISVLNFGKKIAEGTPEEISTNQEVIEAYLGRG